MAFVIKYRDGTYRTSTGYTNTTPYLDKAKVYKRRCDAANGLGMDRAYRGAAEERGVGRIVPVKIVEDAE